MLTQLHIKNVAVIDETDIELKKGLNVLTGETGAGKSIVIDSINMILGQRGGSDLVRHGQQNALIQASFETTNEKVRSLAKEYDALDEGEDTLLLSRKISENGKSTCRINSSVVTSGALRDIGTFLIDIHGQHDNQRLLSASHHIDFLDSFGKDDIACAKEEYIKCYEEYVTLSKKLDSLNENEQSRLERIDFLSFRTDELDKVSLREGEEEELLTQEKLLTNSEEIVKSLSNAYTLLYDNDFTAYDALTLAAKSLDNVSEFDESICEKAQELSDIVAKISDISSQIRMQRDSFDYDGMALFDVQERLGVLSSIKRKYNAEIDEIIKLNEQMHLELDALCSNDESAESVRAQLDECEKLLSQKAKNLTDARTKAKVLFEKFTSDELCDLDMQNVEFSIQITKTDEYTKNGTDKVEFLICTNPGEPLKPLSKIASGGELSRIMLALKTVLADSDDVETLIFDEIDTGVSGRAAAKIASKLCKIAKRRQVICITHLAQIACAADNHYLIKKDIDDSRSSTHIFSLDEKGRIEELSRMLGALSINDTTRAHAASLRKEALKMKAETE